jgi:hypothetical protein
MAGVAAQAIWGTDPERASKLRAHRARELQMLVNCGVLTEGYDDWQVACIIMARPTKSQLLFTQMLGRGFRIPDDLSRKGLTLVQAKEQGIPVAKDDCIVLDVVDTTTKHSLVNLTSLFGLPEQLDLFGKDVLEALEIIETAAEANPGIDFSALTDLSMIDAYVEQVDLFSFKFPEEAMEASELNWYKAPDGTYMLRLPDHEYIQVFKDILEDWSVKGVVRQNEFIMGNFKDVYDAITFGDSMVRLFGYGLLTRLRREAKQNRAPVSLAQTNMLKELMPPDKFGALQLTKMKYGEAQVLINKLMHDNLFQARKQ